MVRCWGLLHSPMRHWLFAALHAARVGFGRQSAIETRLSGGACCSEKHVLPAVPPNQAFNPTTPPPAGPRVNFGVGPMKSTDDFIYVNQDGSVRELSSDEQEFLSQSFHPADGGRPYIKSSHNSQDGWGSISGFLPRSKVPRGVVIEPVNPSYVPIQSDARLEMIEDSRRIGDVISENADGSTTCAPNPSIPLKKRFELLRAIQLERQREREDQARHPSHARKA